MQDYLLDMVATNSSAFVKEDSTHKKPPRPKIESGMPIKLDPDNPWFTNHLVATVSEWILGICFQIVVLTFRYLKILYLIFLNN